ncbi:MAG: hypothetical protein ACTSPD_07115 [Promethearchaeota archaeon]
MPKSKSNLITIFINYFTNLFKRPKVPLTSKQFKSTYWGKIVSIPIVAILWFLSKIPIIGPNIEKAFANKVSKKWYFKPIPNFEILSESAREFKQKRIDVGKEIKIQTKILNTTTFNEIVENFPFAEIRVCGCRSIVRKCDSPKHTCLRLRWAVDVSKKLPDNKKEQIATRNDIKNVLELSDKYALVHMTLHRPDIDHIYVICNCCECCCIGFRQFLVHAIPIMVDSKFVAKIDPKKCVGCFHCINFRCRFRAILKVNEDGTIVDPKEEDKERIKIKWPKWSENRKGWGRQIRKDPPSWEKIKESHSGKWFAKVNSNRCFGCGNCASPKYGCPQGAIKLYLRESKNAKT